MDRDYGPSILLSGLVFEVIGYGAYSRRCLRRLVGRRTAAEDTRRPATTSRSFAQPGSSALPTEGLKQVRVR